VHKLGIDIQTRIGKIKYKSHHGSPYDRGRADSYYRRGFNPHYYTGDTYSSTRIEKGKMNDHQIAAYEAGYYDNETEGNYKEY